MTDPDSSGFISSFFFFNLNVDTLPWTPMLGTDAEIQRKCLDRVQLSALKLQSHPAPVMSLVQKTEMDPTQQTLSSPSSPAQTGASPPNADETDSFHLMTRER